MSFSVYLKTVCDLQAEQDKKESAPKRCSKCLKMKPITEFSMRTKTTRQSRCRQCQAEYDSKRNWSKKKGNTK